MKNQNEMNPRQTMARLPGWMQGPLTRLTGCPLPGQRLRRWRPWHHAAIVIAWFVFGLSLSAALLVAGAPAMLLTPATWFLTLAGVRGLHLALVHHMAHANFSGKKSLDDFLGHVICTLILLDDYDDYKRGHLLHHSEALSTKVDPTRQTYEAAGLFPGMSERMLWFRLVLAMVNPIYHVRTFAARIAGHFRDASWLKRLATIVWLAVLVWLTGVAFWSMVVVWWLPVIVGYQNCSLIRSLIRHWPPPAGKQKGLQVMAAKTTAIFCGVPLPPRGKTLFQELWILICWGTWMSIEMVCRYLFVSADGPNHDLHHLQPQSDWANHAALREPMIERYSRQNVELTESWGFFQVLSEHVRALAGHEPGEEASTVST